MVLVDTEGRSVSGEGPQGGADAVAVELRDASGAVTRHAPVPYPTPACVMSTACIDHAGMLVGLVGLVGLRVLAETCAAVTRHAPVLALSFYPRVPRLCRRIKALQSFCH